MPIFTPVNPPRNPDECPAWLHEAIKRLNRAATSSSQGAAAILRGETPDSSGSPLASILDLTQYLFLPGRFGGQVIIGKPSDTSPTLTVNTAAAGTTTIGATGTPMIRGTYASTTLFDLLPIQFGGGVYDTAIKPNNGGFQVISTDGTAGLRFAPTSGRAYIQTGRLDSSGTVLNPDMTLGGLGATYGNHLGIAFTQVFFEGGAATFPKIGIGVSLNPTAVATWNGVLAVRANNQTEPAITVTPNADGSNGIGLQLRLPPSATSFGKIGLALEYESTTGRGLMKVFNGADPGVSAGYVSSATSEFGGSRGKLTFFDASSRRSMSLDSGTLWADSKTVTLLDLGATVSSFNGACVLGIDAGVLDRFSISSLATLLANAAVGGATVIPAAMLHIRNTANAAQVLQRLQVHASQSADVWQLRDSTDTTSLAWFDKDGNLTVPNIVSTNPSGITRIAIDSSGTFTGTGLILDDGSGFLYQIGSTGSLAADVILTLPTSDGQLVSNLGVVTLTNKTLGSTTKIQCGSGATRAFFVKDTSTTVGFRFETTDLSAARVYRVQNLTGTIPLVGDDPPAVAVGAMGKVDLTAQTTAIGSTNLTNGGLTGIYKVDYVLSVTTADVGAGSVQFQIGYTDRVGATTQAGATLALTATGRQQGSFTLYLNSGELSYLTNVVTIGSAQWAIDARVTYLG